MLHALGDILMSRWLAIVVLGLAPSPVAADFVLVQDGQAKAAIVVSKAALAAEPDPKPEEVAVPQQTAIKIAAAARDLQVYVAQITGTRLPIIGDDESPA